MSKQVKTIVTDEFIELVASEYGADHFVKVADSVNAMSNLGKSELAAAILEAHTRKFEAALKFDVVDGNAQDQFGRVRPLVG